MADLEGDDAFNNVLDRLIKSEIEHRDEYMRRSTAESEVSRLHRDLKIANSNITDLMAKAAAPAPERMVPPDTLNKWSKMSELWTAAKKVLDVGAAASQDQIDRLRKAIQATDDLDEIPF